LCKIFDAVRTILSKTGTGKTDGSSHGFKFFEDQSKVAMRSMIQSRVKIPSDGQSIGDREEGLSGSDEDDVEAMEGDEKMGSSDGGGSAAGRSAVIVGSDCDCIFFSVN
jgi:hypothetical protein